MYKNWKTSIETSSETMSEKWQRNTSFPVTNQHMLEDEALCDITLLAGKQREPVRGHKYILASRSSVFHEQFCGSKSTSVDKVEIPDVEVNVLRQFLRYLYTAECSITSDTVASLLKIAKKYDVISLSENCLAFLHSTITPETVCTALEFALEAKDARRIDKYKTFICDNGRACLQSKAFISTSKEALQAILELNNLAVAEEHVYTACVQWSKEECKRFRKEVSDANCRQLIGPLIQLIRFPCMSKETFKSTVSSSAILTTKEKENMIKYIEGKNVTTNLSTCKIPRGTQKVTPTFGRFSAVADTSWGHNGLSDAISFSCSKPALLTGVGLFRPRTDGKVIGTLHIKEKSSVLHKASIEVPYDADTDCLSVMLKTPLSLQKGVVYTIVQTVRGPRSYFGESGYQRVTVGGMEVTFRDTEDSLNGSVVDRGQFKHILLEL